MDKRRLNVRGIIWRDGKLLAVKHKTKTGGETDYWALPGGGLDPHESIETGVHRELIEELGVTARVGQLLFGQQFLTTRCDFDEEFELFYLIENPEDFENPNFTHTSHGADELARVEWIDPKTELVLPAFLSEIDLEAFATTVQPVEIFNYLADER